MQKELDLKDYYRIIRKQIWVIVGIVLLSTLIVGSYSQFVMEPIYQASTKLIVNKSNEGVGVSQLDLNTVNLNIRLIDTYKEVIKTPAIMDVVAEQYPEWSLTSEDLIRKVQVSSVNNTQVMTLIVQDASHDRAVDIVNAVSEVFIKQIPALVSVDNVSLLSRAKQIESPEPVKPRVALNAAIAFVVSLMAAIGIVFLREYLDDSIKNAEDVSTYLGLPTLAAIPKLKQEDLVHEVEISRVGTRKAGEAKRASVH